VKTQEGMPEPTTTLAS